MSAALQTRQAELLRELQGLEVRARFNGQGDWERERIRVIRLELSLIDAELSGWEARAMSEWINAQLRELRQLQEDVQTVIDALDPPKPKRRYRVRVTSKTGSVAEATSAAISLRTEAVGPRVEERRRIENGEHEVRRVTRGGAHG